MMALILQSFYETVFMVGAAAFFSTLLGLPLGIVLSVTASGGLYPHPWAHHALSSTVNAFRSIPYIILVVLLMPFTRLLVGSSIGTFAAVIPLSLAGILLTARITEEGLRTVPHGLIEVGVAMGATKRQIITKIILPESLPSISANFTMVLINLIGFSAMAGAVGGGGLGDLAIRYGYQRYDLTLLLVIVIILIILVQGVQMAGDLITRKLAR